MKLTSCLIVLITIFASTSMAQNVPAHINYQGRLLEGTNLVTGNVVMSFRLYDSPTATPPHPNYEDSGTVSVVDGLYSTYIGDDDAWNTLPDALNATAVWVEVVIEGTNVLSPREPLKTVGYAYYAKAMPSNAITGHMIADHQINSAHVSDGTISNADLADTAVASNVIDWSTMPTGLHDGDDTADAIASVADVVAAEQDTVAINLLTTGGVWRLRSNRWSYAGNDGGALSSAVANAHYGDLIDVGPGYYDIGVVEFGAENVTIRGSGQPHYDKDTDTLIGGTIITGSIRATTHDTDITVRDLGVYATDELSIFIAGEVGEDNRGVVKNITAVNTGAHGLYFKGGGFSLQNIVTIGSAHPLVLKATRVIADDITTMDGTVSGVNLKADNESGNIRDCRITGVRVESDNTTTTQGIELNATPGYTIENVLISDALISSNTIGTVICEAGTSGTCRNIVIHGVARVGGPGVKVTSCADVTIVGCSVRKSAGYSYINDGSTGIVLSGCLSQDPQLGDYRTLNGGQWSKLEINGTNFMLSVSGKNIVDGSISNVDLAVSSVHSNNIDWSTMPSSVTSADDLGLYIQYGRCTNTLYSNATFRSVVTTGSNIVHEVYHAGAWRAVQTNHSWQQHP